MASLSAFSRDIASQKHISKEIIYHQAFMLFVRPV